MLLFTTMQLGPYLKELRDAKGWSLREAAKRTGLSHSYIDDLERGVSRATGKPTSPTVEALKALANGYGIPVMQLLMIAAGLDTSRAGKGIAPEERAEYHQLKEEIKMNPEQLAEVQRFIQFLKWDAGQGQ